jgi:uncharacterized protein (TIGR04255 family)
VEAVLDIDCDLPPSQEISALERPARDVYRDQYPKLRPQYLHEQTFEPSAEGPPQVSARQGIQGYQFLAEDEKQIVQVRGQGFTFNRLAPYTSLDDYLPEIERTWRLFIGIASPVQVRLIHLRYINRIHVPLAGESAELDEYFRIGPRVPDEGRLRLAAFLNQQTVVEPDTGNQVTIVLANQALDQQQIPVILDIGASRAEAGNPEDWNWIAGRIQSLRALKNRVFREMLTERCLELFR